jgi:hypothetical protein
MPDDLNNRSRPDRDRINVNEAHALHNWALVLGISTHELKQAVQAVGDRVDKVFEHLGARKRPRRASERR